MSKEGEKMKRIRKGRVALVVGVFLIIGLALFFLLTYCPVKAKVSVEAGQKQLDVKTCLKDQDLTAKWKKPLTTEQLKTIGKYDMIVIANNQEYECSVYVEDTTAPKAEAKSVKVYQNQSVKPESFVENIVDATQVKVSFEKEVSTQKIGKQNVTIILEDEAGNQTKIQSKLEVQKDEEAPVIKGTKNIKVAKGKSVSYKKGVTISDNVDKDVTLKIDTSKVNLNKVGEYQVIYSATDSAGNTAKKIIKVSVVSSSSTVTEDEVYAKADEILATIIDDSMTKREKCKQIYNWAHNHISYIDSSDKSSWTKAAMYAFNNHKGDCYNYFAAAKALLTRAGIENIDLKATKHTHYWNFVKVEEGWYHFDTTPRVDHPYLCLRTDAWIDNYSQSHSYCFSYDPASKPASAKE